MAGCRWSWELWQPPAQFSSQSLRTDSKETQQVEFSGTSTVPLPPAWAILLVSSRRWLHPATARCLQPIAWHWAWMLGFRCTTVIAQIQRHVSQEMITVLLPMVMHAGRAIGMQPKVRATWSYLIPRGQQAPTHSLCGSRRRGPWRQASTLPNSQKPSTRLLCIAKSYPFHEVEHWSCHWDWSPCLTLQPSQHVWWDVGWIGADPRQSRFSQPRNEWCSDCIWLLRVCPSQCLQQEQCLRVGVYSFRPFNHHVLQHDFCGQTLSLKFSNKIISLIEWLAYSEVILGSMVTRWFKLLI